jgi:hypothetical protein
MSHAPTRCGQCCAAGRTRSEHDVTHRRPSAPERWHIACLARPRRRVVGRHTGAATRGGNERIRWPWQGPGLAGATAQDAFRERGGLPQPDPGAGFFRAQGLSRGPWTHALDRDADPTRPSGRVPVECDRARHRAQVAACEIECRIDREGDWGPPALEGGNLLVLVAYGRPSSSWRTGRRRGCSSVGTCWYWSLTASFLAHADQGEASPGCSASRGPRGASG